MDTDAPPTSSLQQPRVPPIVHWVAYAALGAALISILIARYVHPLWVHDPIGVATERSGASLDIAFYEDSDHFSPIAQRIDPNEADWPELTRLPGIGETLAKRIVAYRQENRVEASGDTDPPAPVFQRPEDLQAVRGIGPKTVERLAPLLKLPLPPTTQPSSAPH